MFLMVEIRFDIAFVTSIVSCFAKNPSYYYNKAVKIIFCYLKATRSTEITYGGEQGGDLVIKGYFKSDWAGDHVTRRSTSGFIFMPNGEAVSWCSKRQATVVLSSIEAKYVALTLEAKEATWLRLLFMELGLF